VFCDKDKVNEMERKLIGKAEHSTGGHADLFWSFRLSCGYPRVRLDSDCPKKDQCIEKPEYGGVTVRWSGYNDRNWWENVAPSDQARIRKTKCGRTFEIDFKTNEVFELIPPDFTHTTTKELADELATRGGVEEIEIGPDEDYGADRCPRDSTVMIVSHHGPARILIVRIVRGD
jgi:hypothetical protein